MWAITVLDSPRLPSRILNVPRFKGRQISVSWALADFLSGEIHFGATGPVELQLNQAIGQGPWLVFWQCTDKEAIQSSFIDVFDGRLSHDSCPSSSRDTSDTTWKKPFSTWVNEMLLDLSRAGAKNIGRTTGCCGSLTRSIAIYCIYFRRFLRKPTLTPRKPQFCHFPKLS